MTRLGDFFLQKRTALKQSRREVGVESGVTQQTIRSIECGEVVNIGALTLARLAKALGIEASKLGELIMDNEAAIARAGEPAREMPTRRAVPDADRELQESTRRDVPAIPQKPGILGVTVHRMGE